MPWLIGLLLAGASLVALFSLGGSGWLRTVTVLPMNALEWSWYKGLFDRRPIAEAGSSAPILRFGGSKEVDGSIDTQEGGAWCTCWFEADGYGDSVEEVFAHTALIDCWPSWGWRAKVVTLRYARTLCLWSDINILLATPAAMITGKGLC